jgi:hypothetical protein
MRNIMYVSALAHTSIRTATKGGKCMIYTVAVIDHTARAGKFYMGESETIRNKFLKFCFVGYTGVCASR